MIFDSYVSLPEGKLKDIPKILRISPFDKWWSELSKNSYHPNVLAQSWRPEAGKIIYVEGFQWG